MCLTHLAVARAAVLACCRVLACLNDSDAFHAIAMLHAGMHLVEVALLKSCEDPLVLSSNASKASLKGPPCSAFHAATQLCRTTISLTDGTFARSNRSEVLYRSALFTPSRRRARSFKITWVDLSLPCCGPGVNRVRLIPLTLIGTLHSTKLYAESTKRYSSFH